MKVQSDTSSGVRSLRRGLEVLQTIADAGGEVSLRELSRRLELAESTLHGLLQTLVQSGHVLRTADRRYALGHALIRLGEATNRKLSEQAAPSLASLAEMTGENADLVVLEGADAVYLAEAVIPGSVRSAREVERRLPAWSTAAGQALLSQLSRGELALYIERHLPPINSHASQLLTELAHVNRRGYAFEAEEVEPNISCIAMPVPASPTPLALSLTGPTARMTTDRIGEMARQLRGVTVRLGADLRRSLH